MPIANCKRCGRIFNRVRRDICPACVEDEDKAFYVVRDFLKENRDATMDEVVSATEVDSRLITEMIRDGRLILRDHPNMTYACDRCGGPTQTGRFCSACAAELAAGFASASQQIRINMKDQNNKGKGYFSKH